MNQLFLMKEYPADVLPMYAQGYSVCRFLIDQKGPRTFIEFLGEYMKHPSWTDNVKRYYGYDSLKELQDYWLAWVSQGGGPVEKFAKLDRSAAAGQPMPTRSHPATRRRLAMATGSGGLSATVLPTPASTDLASDGTGNKTIGPGRSSSRLDQLNRCQPVPAASCRDAGSSGARQSRQHGSATDGT